MSCLKMASGTQSGPISLPKGMSMIRELCKDDAILSKKCQRATPEDAPLAQDLIDTLRW